MDYQTSLSRLVTYTPRSFHLPHIKCSVHINYWSFYFINVPIYGLSNCSI